MSNIQPVFIVGTGRSGSRSIFRMLSGSENLEIHHEYCCTHIQKYSALYHMGLISEEEIINQINKIYKPALKYSEAPIWVDSSNKLSWIIKPLHKTFPNAKFLMIARDGRKVVPSFYYKLRDEMYDDKSVKILTKWIDDQQTNIMPPPEKKYWWNIPQVGQKFHKRFKNYNRLQRTAFHWTECNRVILESFSNLPQNTSKVVRLEDIVRSETDLKDMIEFIGIKYDNLFFKYMQTPRNVFFPMSFKLTRNQNVQFEEICNSMMKKLGYDIEEVNEIKY